MLRTVSAHSLVCSEDACISFWILAMRNENVLAFVLSGRWIDWTRIRVYVSNNKFTPTFSLMPLTASSIVWHQFVSWMFVGLVCGCALMESTHTEKQKKKDV